MVNYLLPFDNPRKLMLTAIGCGAALGLLGGAQVNTRMNAGPPPPWQWADSWAPPRESMQFADSVPLDLDVPTDFQIAHVSYEGDPTRPDRALGSAPRDNWAALHLAEYKVAPPETLPEPAADAQSDAAISAQRSTEDTAMRMRTDAASGHPDLETVSQPGADAAPDEKADTDRSA